MLSFIKKLIWKEDPVDVVSSEAIDIIKRYHRLGAHERHDVISAFEYTQSQLEINHGEIHTWGTNHKASLAAQVLKVAREAYTAAPHDAYGVALVGLYLEAQTLPGENAKQLVVLIDEWKRRAVASGLKG
jgi:hypothetical protein